MSYASTLTGEVIDVRPIPIGDIDNGPAVRSELLDHDHAVALWENVDNLPNIKVRRVGDRYELIDGRHRLAAHKFAKRDAITAEVYDLDDRSALIAAMHANVTHGRGLSLVERRANAQRLVNVAPDLSNREIARITGLSHPTVAKLRPETSGKNYHSEDATQDGAGVDGPASEGDATTGGDGADSHDVGRTVPEPAPSSTLTGDEAGGGTVTRSGSDTATSPETEPPPPQDRSTPVPDPGEPGDREAPDEPSVSPSPGSPTADGWDLLPVVNDAIASTRYLLSLDPETVAAFAGDDTWGRLGVLYADLDSWFERLSAAREGRAA